MILEEVIDKLEKIEEELENAVDNLDDLYCMIGSEYEDDIQNKMEIIEKIKKELSKLRVGMEVRMYE